MNKDPELSRTLVCLPHYLKEDIRNISAERVNRVYSPMSPRALQNKHRSNSIYTSKLHAQHDPSTIIPTPYTCAAAFAANHAEKACAFLVCMKTVPGPVNLHTSPSPDDIFDKMPPEATRSRTYLQFHATRWPLSMMYFSSFWSCAEC